MGYKASKEYVLKQARELRNERSSSESPAVGPVKKDPLNRLDHFEGQEEESEEGAEALALAKGKGKGKGFKGDCFNCGKTGHRAADCWAKGGGKERQKGPKGSYGKGTNGGIMDVLMGSGFDNGKGSKGKSWGMGKWGFLGKGQRGEPPRRQQLMEVLDSADAGPGTSN